MSPNLEAATYLGKPLQIKGALLELGYGPTVLADEVMVVILGQLVTRTVAEVKPADESKLGEKVQRPVHRHHPDLGTAGPNLLHSLVLLRGNRPEYRQPLRRDLVPDTTYLSYRLLNRQIEHFQASS